MLTLNFVSPMLASMTQCPLLPLSDPQEGSTGTQVSQKPGVTFLHGTGLEPLRKGIPLVREENDHFACL